MIRNLSLSSVFILMGLGVAVCFALVVATVGDGDEDDTGKKDVENEDISHGLGNHIAWMSLKEGRLLSEEKDKPLMLIIHKSWCGACRALKPKIKESAEIGELSKNFVMVNTEDDDEPTEDIYRPDGGYIPRILFFNPKGELLKDVVNEDGNPKYKYYYYDVESVLVSMNKVVAMFQNPSDSIDDRNLNIENAKVVEILDEQDYEKTEL